MTAHPSSLAAANGSYGQTLFESAFQLSAAPMLVARMDTTVIAANDALVRLLCRPREQIIGHTTKELMISLASETRDELVAALERDHRLRHVLHSIVTPSGTRELDASFDLVEIDGVPHVVAVLVDLTEAMKAEELAAAAIYAGPAGMVISTLDGRLLQVNKAFAAALDYSPDELTGKNSAEINLWWDQAQRNDVIDSLTRLGIITGLELSFRSKTGRRIEFAASWQLMSVGGTPHIFCIAVDLSEKIAAQARARENEQRFHEIANSIREVFWLTTLDKREMLYISPSYERVWGQSCESLIRQPGQWLEAVHPEDQPRVRAAAAQQDVQPYDERYRIIRPDGAVRWIHDRSIVVRDAAGRPQRLCGVAEDVTERRKLEEQFQQAQKLESIGKLAGGVAHDFNNVLTVISSSNQCLAEELADRPDLADLTREVRVAVERASALTRQLLAFSRQQVIEPVVLDVSKLVLDTEKMLSRLLGEDIRITTRLPADLPLVKVDPGQLNQVLMNLTVNARDAMPNGGQLLIETTPVELDASDAAGHLGAHPGPHVRLSVTDTGSGMSREVLAHLFEPFFTTKAPGKGTGLGLSVVFGVVQQAGGHVEVLSAPGAGSTFHVFLPVCTQEKPAERSSEKGASRGDETILVVEDEDAVRRVAVRTLSSLGYRVLEAATAEAALDLFGSNLPQLDLLVTDVVMPGLDGRRLSEQVARRLPGLRVLFVSGYTDDAVVRYGVLRENVSFLSKPFTPEMLGRKVRQVLDAAPSAPLAKDTEQVARARRAQ